MEGVLLKCVDEEHLVTILNEMHNGVCGGHFMDKTTVHKVIKASFRWTTLFKDAQELVKKCDASQRFSGKLKFFSSLPLRPIEV